MSEQPANGASQARAKDGLSSEQRVGGNTITSRIRSRLGQDREPNGRELDGTDASAIARHVAIIMDGNHRWAKRRHLPGAAGHRAGAKNVKTVAKACADHGVKFLTLFAFSTENWQRPSREVNLLIDLMRGVLEHDVDELHANEVRLSIIGDRSAFASDCLLYTSPSPRDATLSRMPSSA